MKRKYWSVTKARCDSFDAKERGFWGKTKGELRKQYLRNLAVELGIREGIVIAKAQEMGPENDYDNLIVSLENMLYIDPVGVAR